VTKTPLLVKKVPDISQGSVETASRCDGEVKGMKEGGTTTFNGVPGFHFWGGY